MSQEYAAGLLNVCPRTLSDYENGKTIVPDDVVVKMGEIYQTQYLVWWHLKNRTLYGSILPDVFEAASIGDTMFSFMLAIDEATESFETYKDVFRDKKLDEMELPEMVAAASQLKHAIDLLQTTYLFTEETIKKCKQGRE